MRAKNGPPSPFVSQCNVSIFPTPPCPFVCHVRICPSPPFLATSVLSTDSILYTQFPYEFNTKLYVKPIFFINIFSDFSIGQTSLTTLSASCIICLTPLPPLSDDVSFFQPPASPSAADIICEQPPTNTIKHIFFNVFARFDSGQIKQKKEICCFTGLVCTCDECRYVCR